MVGPSLAVGLAAITLWADNSVKAEERRPIGLDDVLAMEALGSGRLSHDGEWAAIAVRGGWDRAAVYRNSEFTAALLSRLLVQRTDGSGRPIVLASADHSVGYAAGPFSPDGRRLVVTAVSADTYRLGVLTLDSGEVRWLAVTPELPRLGQTIVWRSPDRLLVAARPLDDMPVRWAVGAIAQTRTPALWARTAAGEAGVHVVYSGDRRDIRPHVQDAGVVEIDAATGQVRRLVEGEAFDLSPSPDGTSVAAFIEGHDLQIAPETPAVTGNPVRRNRVLLLRSDSSIVEPAPEIEFASHLLAWSSDSRTLLAYGRHGSQSFEEGAFYRIRSSVAEPVDLGQDRPWIDRSDQGLPVARAAFVDGAFWLQVRTPEGTRAWRREDGSHHKAVVEEGERLAEREGKGWVVRLAEMVALDGSERLSGRLLGPSGDADRSNRLAMDGDPTVIGAGALLRADGCLDNRDGPPTCLRDGDSPIAAAAKGVILGRRRAAGGASSVVWATPGGDRSAVTVNSDLDGRDWGRVEEIVPETQEDGPASSWLLLPSRTAGGDPPPLIVLMYPGHVFYQAPSWLRPGTDRAHISPMALAAAGYAVLAPSLAVPSDRPVEAEELSLRLDQILSSVEARRLADTERVALVGHSFGAYGALFVGTHTDRYRAIIASNGYADLSGSQDMPTGMRMLREAGPWYLPRAAWAETGQAHLGASLGRRPETWVEHSPLYSAGRLTTPTLLIESDLDGSRNGSLFGLLYRDNREAALVTYFGEGHVYSSPGNLRDMHARILDWLERYVRPSKPFEPRGPMARPSFHHAPDQETIAPRIGDQALD